MRRVPPLAVVLALLGAGGGAAQLTRPAASSEVRRQSATPVVGAVAVCPDVQQAPGSLASRVSVGVAPAAQGGSGTGAIVAQPLGVEAAAPPLPVDGPGQVVTRLATGLDDDALVVSATGPLAAGLEVEMVTRGESGPLRGFLGMRCEAPRTDQWFVGGGTSVGQSSLLVLVNPDPTAAVVDVTALTDDGPVDARQGKGVTVPPRGRVLLALDTIAPDQAVLAVRVQAQRGRAAAALRHSRVDGRTARGAEWVPQSLAPSTAVVVPGLAPRKAGTRAVLVANPGLDDAVVQVRLTTADSQSVPTGLDAIEVPAGSVRAVDLTTAVGESAAAVEVLSDGVPVMASGLLDDVQEAGPVREISYAASSPALSGVAVLTDLVIDRPTESTLVLTALTDEASVDVTPISIAGTTGALPPPKRVLVPAGRTVVLALSTFLPPGATGQLAVEVRPSDGSGPVHAARYLRARGARGPLTTLLALRGAAQQVPLADVAADPSAGR